VAAQSGGAGDQSGRRRDPKRPPERSVGRLGLDPGFDPEPAKLGGQPLRRLALAGGCARAFDRAELVEKTPVPA
jgi:hypothetical protein